LAAGNHRHHEGIAPRDRGRLDRGGAKQVGNRFAVRRLQLGSPAPQGCYVDIGRWDGGGRGR